MSLVTPEYLQTKTYTAMRDRLTLMHGGAIQPGVWDAGDFKITQRAAGANLTMDVATGYALVPANDSGNAGLYHIQNDASLNTGTGAANGHATLPRIDQAILTVNDTTSGGDATDTPSVTILGGTATSGATLDNRTGATALPTGAIRLADILMPAASTTIATANIRDRRPWARGFNRMILGGATLYTTASATMALISSANLTPRVECSGAAMLVQFATVLSLDTVTTGGNIELWMDGAKVSGTTTYSWVDPTAAAPQSVTYTWLFTPAAGSHLIGPAFNASAGFTFRVGSGTVPSSLLIQEVARQNSDNT